MNPSNIEYLIISCFLCSNFYFL